MTDLDVYFWRCFALGAGFGVVWCSWSWLVTMGRAARFWFTLPHEAHPLYTEVYTMLRSYPGDRPDWYCHYVAFREVGMLKP